MIFVAACDFSKKARDTFREWCGARGISEAHIWGKAELEDQLYQPKNDGLLFAYFGFSLRIRRRSIRTELRARLAMKRKAERILEHQRAILLRDPTDSRCPWAERGEPPGRWRVTTFFEHHPLGMMILIRRFFAYLSDHCQTWDYIERSEATGFHWSDNPWHDATQDPSQDDANEQHRIRTFWHALPDRNQANYYKVHIIPYEDILDMDEKGDGLARMPHVYLQNVLMREEGGFLENLIRYNPTRVTLPDARRVDFSPNTFPEPPRVEDAASE